METRLFIRAPETKAEEKAALWGTFHPLGKAHTIPLL
jgi:hypothetical protein